MSTDKQPKKKQRPSHEVTHILVIDVETTGQNAVQNWMPEFAGVVWAIGAEEPVDSFYRVLKCPEGRTWCPVTKREFWEDAEKGHNGKTPMQLYEERRSAAGSEEANPDDAMAEFVAWAQQHERDVKKAGGKIIVVFDTAGFDATWMNVYLGQSSQRTDCGSINYLFGQYRPTRDIDSFKFGMGRQLKVWGSEGVGLRAVGASIKGFPDWVEKHAHNHHPLSDAHNIAAQASFFLSKCTQA